MDDNAHWVVASHYQPNYAKFELLCARLLARYLDIPHDRVQHVKTLGDAGFDLSADLADGLVVAEVKFYRSLRIPSDWLAKAVRPLEFARVAAKAQKAILMISARAERVQRTVIEEKGISLIDLDDLIQLAAGDEDATNELESLFGTSVLATDDNLVARTEARRFPYAPRPSAPTVPIGKALCAAIKRLKSGQREATAYERAVRDALTYIFQGQLVSWTLQGSTDDSLRRDITAKILGEHRFWQEIIRDFRTRFVLFDCKNYRGDITQADVYSTEKYLHRSALRAFAVIVCRRAPNKGALNAMKGAIRESDRLITWLNDEDLCAMLDARDRGDEVHEILMERIDAMLLEIAR